MAEGLRVSKGPEADHGPKLRAIFTEFRDLWIALANRKQFLTPAELDTEIEALSNIYNEWVSERQDAGAARLSVEVASLTPFHTRLARADEVIE